MASRETEKIYVDLLGRSWLIFDPADPKDVIDLYLLHEQGVEIPDTVRCLWLLRVDDPE